ncbi:MAG: hypothetical protein IT384_05875 [Deltaproteobacteria bacterium]|nr:hypothetical protein [Deltaproteobacteria bacterium]
MRVTEGRLLELASRAMREQQSRVGEASAQLSSGARVRVASEDPAAWAEATRARAEAVLRRGESSALGRASDRLGESEAVLASVSESLSRALELSVQLGNDTYSPADRARAAEEVRGLSQALMTLVNSKDGLGEPLFAGAAIDGPAFDASGAYVGDADPRAIATMDGQLVSTALTGDRLASGVNPFAILDQLATALASNDGAAVRSLVGDLQGTVGQAADAQATVGEYRARIQGALDAQGALLTQIDQRTARLVGADPIAAASDLAKAAGGVEAARAAAETILSAFRSR